MNLELHTDGRELAVVGCELNGTGCVCFLSGSRAASYQGLQAADRDCELVVMRTEAEFV
ncbi:hypothetical protein F2Q69_00048460 [Brassica cretica]|uniref:Uncharacterized protein n=1 Tax=Brassica cretica TaxID=69181 RepID=A0A8S9Q056_BRACR|nr:hypothetical protein F2Q69_00048460 [Brassica cretica]